MLETIRDFALEQLHTRAEANATRRKHLAHYTALIETLAPKMWGADFAACAAQMDDELGNLRAALQWSLDSPDACAEEVDLGARLTGSLWQYWNYRGYTNEGRQWLERAIAKMRVPGKTRAKILSSAGWLTW